MEINEERQKNIAVNFQEYEKAKTHNK